MSSKVVVVDMQRGHCFELSMRMLASLCILLIINEPTITEGRYLGCRSDRISNSDDGITTILSIDGGGVKGVIPGTILAELESMLQKIDDDENARIADYFDIVAGTSTGGIITGLLTTPDDSGRPLYPAKEINQFYFDHAPGIFWLNESLDSIGELLRELREPKYNGTYYYKVVREVTGGIRLDETATNVVIPTYDMKLLKPTIFISSQAKHDESMNALLSDVVIGTAAAPTLFPPYSFQINTSTGVTTEFNLYDGGLVAGNPTLVALSETVKEMNGNVDYTKFRVLSLGTGTVELEGYEADSHSWGKLNFRYLLLGPISSTAGARMAELYADMLLQTDIYPNNYLRIQIDTLNSTENSTDDPSTENLQHLVEIGEKLLNQTLTKYDPSTGRFLPVLNGVTTRQSLLGFAEELSAEKKRRESKRKLFGAI